MAAIARSGLAFAPQTTHEDPLTYLPRATVVGYKKNQLIYGQDSPPTGIYMIIEGRVKISRLAEDGQEVVVDILRSSDFFGESALLGLEYNAEQATAMEGTKVMTWNAGEIEDLVSRQPKLAVALWQILVERMVDFGHRIESLSLDTVARRLARCLIRFSEHLGTPADDGSIHMGALTHELLARHVGTSREIVSHDMSGFRRQGYLKYSRKGIAVYRDALKEWLHQDARVVLPR